MTGIIKLYYSLKCAAWYSKLKRTVFQGHLAISICWDDYQDCSSNYFINLQWCTVRLKWNASTSVVHKYDNFCRTLNTLSAVIPFIKQKSVAHPKLVLSNEVLCILVAQGSSKLQEVKVWGLKICLATGVLSQLQL